MFDNTSKLTINEAKAVTVALSARIAGSKTLEELKKALPIPMVFHPNGLPKDTSINLRKWLEEVRGRILGPYTRDFTPFIAPILKAVDDKLREFRPPSKPPSDW